VLAKRGLDIQRKRLRGKSLAVAVDVEWVDNESLAESFAYAGTVEQPVVDAIAAAPGALVLHWPVDLLEGRATIVSIVKKLRAAGALAVRVEQSKLGWAIDDWIDMLGSPVPGAWHRCVIVMLNTKGMLQSCGMHAFSLPDVRVDAGDDPSAMHHLASTLDVYQLAERPSIVSGETFGLDAASPRRLLERWPDTNYPSDHTCHNPYGVWRVGPPGGTARGRGALVPVIIPALRLVLAAVEHKQRRPLTKKQVEAIRDRASAMTMRPQDMYRMDHARGYADIDPELAWPQWKLVRQK